MQGLSTETKDALHVVGDGQTAGKSNSEYLQRRNLYDARQRGRQRRIVANSAAGEYYFHALFAVN